MIIDSVHFYDFDLPDTHIAHKPAHPRDAARLLEITSGRLQDRHVFNLPDLLKAGDVLVSNDTAVIPAQLVAWRGQAKIGLTLDRILADGSWHVLAKNARRLHTGDELVFSPPPEPSPIKAHVTTLEEGGGAVIRFNIEGKEFDHFLKSYGKLALPPYIHRPEGPTPQDEADYKTIFSRVQGAVAAPTAGLHFTPQLLAKLTQKGIQHHNITLHVGAGTFLPMRSDTISAHVMHPEQGYITEETAAFLNQAKKNGQRIIAIGTTTLRLLESAADEDGIIHPFHQETSIFIRPGYRFKAVDLLMTNFHLPRSTLFMLVCAFGGTETMKAAYQHAITQNYRFYSYGDACLITCSPTEGQ